jgi:hypothetical protein
MSDSLVEYFRNTLMQEVHHALLFPDIEPKDLPEFGRPAEPSFPTTVAPTPEPFGMAKVMPNVPRVPEDPERLELDGGIPYTTNAKLFFKVAAAGGQEKYAASLEHATVTEEHFAGALLKSYSQAGKVFRVETWRDGRLEDVTDGAGRSLAKLAKHAPEAHSGSLAKVFQVEDDREAIDHKSIQHYVPR